ncbi:MAG: hypothetical protein EOO29_54395 [Comamonadaceae bacterium]|nr:MAG: hypothetical protein EOO29_54395 [Comamonadaceae bacterium]
MDHPDGLLLQTRESEEFLVLNGTQTQSARVYNLLDAMDDMRALGVDVVRLSPQASDMQEVITLFNQARHRLLPGAEAMARLAPLMPGEGCNGYWHGKPGLEQCAVQEPVTA